MRRLPDHLTLIFDGSCNFCTWAVELLERLDHGGRVRAVPFQAPGTLEEAGLEQRDAEAAVWAMSPSGKRYRGAGAVNLALAVALGTRLPMNLYRLPGLRQLQDGAYAAIARNRHRFRGTQPFCQQHPEVCTASNQ